MSPAPTSPRRPSPPSPSPHSRDLESEAAMYACTASLAGHGPRRVETLLASIPVDTEVDYYGVGGVVADLEAEVAALLGKPAALFLPSGTMAQQIVLRVHGERRGRRSVVCHPACHLDSHEERGYQQLHGLHVIPVGARTEPLSLASLRTVGEPVGTLLVELPQRDLGGTLPTWRELTAQAEWARSRGAAVHLDGARLWESTSYYRKTPAEVAALFDSVYVSFYKGLGALTGCCVAGERDVIDDVSVWRTRHGGRLFAMWPYAASAQAMLHERLPKMPAYFRHARAIATALGDVANVEVMPERVRSSMMHLRLGVSTQELRSRALQIARDEKVWTFARPFRSDGPRLQCVELGVGDATLALAPHEVARLIDRLANGTSAKGRPKKRTT